MSRITALVLSVGEPTLERALDSVRRQTLAPCATTIVPGVEPFHRAMRTGVERVDTEHFVQVDADMVLDRTCFATLHSHMADRVGMVVGRLRDPLEGVIVGVKLIRTECARRFPMPDTLSADTDFLDALRAAGWSVPFLDSSLGRHQPQYTPLYTFSKYRLLGNRARYRRSLAMLRRRFRNLDRCPLDVAFVAQVALARGVFCTDDRDRQAPVTQDAEFDVLRAFLSAGGDGYHMASETVDGAGDLSPGARFAACCRLGATLRADGSAGAFRQAFSRLRGAGDDSGWLARVGLARGLYRGEVNVDQIDQDFAFLKRAFGDDLE